MHIYTQRGIQCLLPLPLSHSLSLFLCLCLSHSLSLSLSLSLLFSFFLAFSFFFLFFKCDCTRTRVPIFCSLSHTLFPPTLFYLFLLFCLFLLFHALFSSYYYSFMRIHLFVVISRYFLLFHPLFLFPSPSLPRFLSTRAFIAIWFSPSRTHLIYPSLDLSVDQSI